MDLKDFEKGLRKLLRKRESKAVITKQDILNHLEDTRQHLNIFRGMWENENLSPDYAKQLWNQTQQLSDDGLFATKYDEFRNRLQGKAAKAETNEPFIACKKVADKLDGMLNGIRGKVNKSFPAKINIHTARYSHLSLLGALHVCDQFAQFSIYLHQGLIWEISKATRRPPQYRIKYVEKHFWAMVNLVNKSFAGTGPITLPSVMEHLQKANNDLTVTNDEGEPNTGFFNKSRAGSTTMNLLGISLENPFWILGKMYSEWKQARMDKIEQERDWMEANLSLLKMDLENVDPDSEEYQRTVKIIENYEAMVAKLDRKLDEYYENSED